MQRIPIVMALAAALGAPLAAQAGEATVQFVAPETYSDADLGQRPGAERGRAQVLGEIERHLQGLARRSLPADQTLAVEVLDVDLAGRVEPFALGGSQALRVVRAIDIPRIHLRYRLQQGDRTVAQGEERLSDLGFLNSPWRRVGTEPLGHEKALLDRWVSRLTTRR